MDNAIILSGGFDPLHAGHIEMIKKAKKYGDVYILLNNDHWLYKKKGYIFMPEKDRLQILESISGIGEVFLTKHKKNPKDMTVVKDLIALKKILLDTDYGWGRPKVIFFGNGGDRTRTTTPELEWCEANNVIPLFNLGKKRRSSSDLIRGAAAKLIEMEAFA